MKINIKELKFNNLEQYYIKHYNLKNNENNIFLKCNKCNQSKNVLDFPLHKLTDVGIMLYCNDCKKLQDKSYRKPKTQIPKINIKDYKNIKDVPKSIVEKYNLQQRNDGIYKPCPVCKELKNVKKNLKDLRGNIGIQLKCNECSKNHVKEYHKNNPELHQKFKQTNKQILLKNKDTYNKNRRDKVNNNPVLKEKQRKVSEKYKINNPNSKKKWYLKNKEYVNEYNTQYHKKNRNKIIQYNRDRSEDKKEWAITKQKEKLKGFVKSQKLEKFDYDKCKFYVYVFEWEDKIKIGKSNNPFGRLKRMKRYWGDCKLSALYYCDERYKMDNMERHLHLTFRDYNLSLNENVEGYTEMFTKDCLKPLIVELDKFTNVIYNIH